MITISMPPSGTFGAFKPQAPKERPYLSYLVVAVIIILLGSGYYLFFYKGVDLSLEKPVLQPAPPLNDLETKIIKLQKFSFEVIDGPFYKSLKSYGVVPVKADSLGRLNPFIPY